MKKARWRASVSPRVKFCLKIASVWTLLEDKVTTVLTQSWSDNLQLRPGVGEERAGVDRLLLLLPAAAVAMIWAVARRPLVLMTAAVVSEVSAAVRASTGGVEVLLTVGAVMVVVVVGAIVRVWRGAEEEEEAAVGAIVRAWRGGDVEEVKVAALGAIIRVWRGMAVDVQRQVGRAVVPVVLSANFHAVVAPPVAAAWLETVVDGDSDGGVKARLAVSG